MAHYVIFVEAFCPPSQSRTVQLCPLVLGSRAPLSSPSRSGATQTTDRDHPMALLSLSELLYGRSPLAWWLRVPAESFECSKKLSMTAEQGCDRALRTIGQFLKTYQQPVVVSHAMSATSAKRHQRPDYQHDYQQKAVSAKPRTLAPINAAASRYPR